MGHTFFFLYFVLQVTNGIICPEKQADSSNYTLSVTAVVVDDNSITLTCNSLTIPLTSKRYLKWTERGRELPNSYHVQPLDNGGITVTIHNASYLDNGVFTCRCYNNFSVADIEEIYYNSGHMYYHHCSEPFSITTSALLDQEVSISDHIVNTINTIVEIGCNDTTDLLYDANNSSESLNYPLSVIVDSPSKQGKYVCVDQSNNLTAIHYILIKDYEAPVFLFTSSESSVIYASDGTVPTCAVYSSIPVTSLKFYSMAGDAVILIGEDSSLNTGLYLVTGSGFLVRSLSAYLDKCVAKTVWETIEISYDLRVSEKPFVPSVCLYASVDSYNDTIFYGDSFTVHCVLFSLSNLEGKIVKLLHISIDGTETHLPLEYSESEGHDVYNFRAVVSNVSESNIGEYICMFTLDTTAYHLEENDSVTVNHITSRPEVDVLPSNSTTFSTMAYTSYTSSTKSILQTTHFTTVNTPSVLTNGTSSDSMIQPIMYSIIAGCSIIILIVCIAVLVTIILICYCKRQQHKLGAINGNRLSKETGYEFKEGNVAEEMDGISVWSFRSLSSVTEDLHPENKISENMKKCAQTLIASKWYIPYDKILFHECIGSGAFGKVKRAEMYGIKDSPCVSNVAVKMLKDNASEEDEKDIITELRVLQNVEAHMNIVSLIGASIHNGRLLVIVEYCPGGNLLHYLRDKKHDTRNPLTVSQQLNMGRQIACGMDHLSSRKCVHRDLAARNILIAKDGTLKVADFGLARETYHSMYKMSTKGKIPFKWMAPESIFYRVYTSASDVWSFGVLLWEIATFGWSPYPGKSIEEVISDLQKKKLMERPATCPVSVFNFILMCWKFEPNERPSFSTLVQLLEEFVPAEMSDTEDDEDKHFESSSNGNSLDPGRTDNVNRLELLSTSILQSNIFSQSKEDEYSYNEEFQESEGYISCSENRRISPIIIGTGPSIDYESNGGVVKMCNLYKIKCSGSELGSVGSDVFTDSETDDSLKASPLSVRGDSINYSQKSGESDSGLVTDLTPFVLSSSDSKCMHNVDTQNPGYLQTMYI